MITFVIAVHIISCIALIGLVLIQRGRGSGLVDSFQGVESMFGTKTSSFLTRATTIFSILFFLTCLSLAVLSVQQSKSLIGAVKPPAQEAVREDAAGAGEPSSAPAQIPEKEEPQNAQKSEKPQEAPKAE